MLVIQRPDGWLCDREALATWLKRPIPTIRKHCPIADYTGDGRALYNVEHCELILNAIPERRWRRLAS